ncbi:hypothetical protein DSTSK_02030 [Desulforhabdus sp. TSK]|nr:hypothetical protein DSTSK_02030 [Desulforhabdus sp. TSK]
MDLLALPMVSKKVINFRFAAYAPRVLMDGAHSLGVVAVDFMSPLLPWQKGTFKRDEWEV